MQSAASFQFEKPISNSGEKGQLKTNLNEAIPFVWNCQYFKTKNSYEFTGIKYSDSRVFSNFPLA